MQPLPLRLLAKLTEAAAQFEKIVFVGGGVQYQQLTAGWQWPGWFDFVWCGAKAPFFPIANGSSKRFGSGAGA